MDFSKQVFRCSSLGDLMTNQQGKTDTKSVKEISETAKKALIKIYVHTVYGRDKEITSKYIDKGLQVEEDSITLLSRIDRKLLLKNEIRFTNDFITGEPDVIEPLYDTKSCWDLHSFFEHKSAKELKKEYKYQMLGYTDLAGKDSGSVVFCLIDTPLGIIEDEKRKLFYKMNAGTTENAEYLEACAQLEKEMMFSDIPMEQRIHKILVKRDPAEIERVYARVPLWREWLNEFAGKEIIEVPVPETV